MSQAQRIEVVGDRLVFAFPPARQTLAAQLKAKREWIETLSARVVGRRLTVEAVQEQPAEAQGAQEQAAAAVAPGAGGAAGTGTMAGEGSVTKGGSPVADGPSTRLRERALGDSVVKAMLELFPAEITSVEKI